MTMSLTDLILRLCTYRLSIYARKQCLEVTIFKTMATLNKSTSNIISCEAVIDVANEPFRCVTK